MEPNTVPQEPATRKTLPYRWGYFQGVFLIPFSLVMILEALTDLLVHHRNPYLNTPMLLMGLTGIPLAITILRKKKTLLPLVYAMFGLALLQCAMQLLTAIANFADQGDKGSAFFEAEWLFFWLISTVYYRKREQQLS